MSDVLTTENFKKNSVFSRLYRGDTTFDFVGRKNIWFILSMIVIAAGAISFGVKGLDLSIDFKGGVSWQVASHNINVSNVQKAVQKAGAENPTITVLGGKTISVDAKVLGNQATRDAVETKVTNALAKLTHTKPSDVSVSFVGPSWGGNISSKAIRALIIFFVLIALYISFRFEWRMALAAIVAVIHDLAVTVGVYSISGFQVTPDTVIAVLTILGYSLYDTVVVFDRVRDNANGIGKTGRISYSDMVNLSMNQVLMRSINTSLVAVIPILSVLVFGAYILGAATLQYFGLALFIGLTSGAYSSIFIASPLLAILKEKDPRYATIRKRLEARGVTSQNISPAQLARNTQKNLQTSLGKNSGKGSKVQTGIITPGSASLNSEISDSSSTLTQTGSENEENIKPSGKEVVSNAAPSSKSSQNLPVGQDGLVARPRKKTKKR